ncbi:MAG: DUF4230 domain-containing protein [Pleurocapsa sp.]
MKTFKSSISFWQLLLFWGAGSLNLIIILILLSIWRTGDRAFNFIGNLFNIRSAEPKIERLTPIVQQIKNIQELSTIVQTIETIVPASADRKLGDISLATTRLLYIARGEIRAGVDLSELKNTDIKISNNNIEIDLPAAKILDSKIDVNHSRVYDYDRGLFNLGPDVAPQLQTLAQRKTLIEIVNTACNEGILNSANLKAQETITQLLANTGYQQVTINTTQPNSCKITKQNTDRPDKISSR